MNMYSVRIEEFSKNGNPWRLDGIGKVIYPSSLRSEPLVTVYLSELKPDNEDAFTSDATTEKGFVARIKVGQFSILKLSYVWRNQVRLTHKRRPRKVSLRIEDAQIELLNFGASIEINNNIEALVSAYRHRPIQGHIRCALIVHTGI